jgi:ELWxxDGT repeat protein
MATNVLLFAGLDKNGDNNLWVTDGTAAGTSEISIAGVGSEGLFGLPPASPYFAGSPDGRVLFSGIDAKGDFNLWVTNGTAAGTSDISLATQDPGGLNPQFLTVFGSKVLFEGVEKTRWQSVGHQRHGCWNLRAFRQGPAPAQLRPPRFHGAGQQSFVQCPGLQQQLRPLGDERHSGGNVRDFRS